MGVDRSQPSIFNDLIYKEETDISFIFVNPPKSMSNSWGYKPVVIQNFLFPLNNITCLIFHLYCNFHHKKLRQSLSFINYYIYNLV